MELERMRGLLATKAMGWEVRGATVIDKGGGRFMLRNWTPDADWLQCGEVIERMREMGWWMTASMNKSSWAVGFYRQHEGNSVDALAYAFTEAASVAAARALESEATDG